MGGGGGGGLKSNQTSNLRLCCGGWVGGWWWWINPLQTLPQDLVLTFDIDPDPELDKRHS